MADALISMADVRARTTLSKTHIYRLIKWGEFPEPVPVGPHRRAWIEREVNEWIAERISQRA